MRIRTKLLAAVAVPLVLLVAQVAAVSVFIRELQSAVTFIGEAHRVIEADFGALELVGALREEVKRLPSRYVSAPANAAAEVNPMQALWDQLTSRVDLIEASGVALAIEPHVLEAVRQAFGKASEQYERTEEVADGATDLRHSDRAGSLRRQGAGRAGRGIAGARRRAAQAASGGGRPGARDSQSAGHRRYRDRRARSVAAHGFRLALRAQSGRSDPRACRRAPPGSAGAT